VLNPVTALINESLRIILVWINVFLKLNLYKISIMVLVLKKGASKKEIEAITEKLAKIRRKKRFDAKKHCGVIRLQEDALDIQKRLRDEWN